MHAPTSQLTSSARPARSARAPSDMHGHVWARRARDGPAQRAHPRSPMATLHHGPAALDTPGACPYTRLTHLTRAPRLCATRLHRCRAEPPRRARRAVVVVEAATTQVLRGLLTVPPQPPRSASAASAVAVHTTSPPAASATRHDSCSPALLQRPTHGPELHRAATGERRHRCHASGTARTPKTPSSDTKCWNRIPPSLSARGRRRHKTQEILGRRTNAAVGARTP